MGSSEIALDLRSVRLSCPLLQELLLLQRAGRTAPVTPTDPIIRLRSVRTRAGAWQQDVYIHFKHHGLFMTAMVNEVFKHLSTVAANLHSCFITSFSLSVLVEVFFFHLYYVDSVTKPSLNPKYGKVSYIIFEKYLQYILTKTISRYHLRQDRNTHLWYHFIVNKDHRFVSWLVCYVESSLKKGEWSLKTLNYA